MSTSVPLQKLRQEYRRIEGELKQLRDQKEKVDERFSSLLKEEKQLVEDMRKSRDPYQYSRIDLRLSTVARSRKGAESEKLEIDRKIRGYEEELSQIKRRIEYLTPKRAS
jgi:chromosome segregation ATPase